MTTMTLLNDAERRIYDLSIAQKYDPERAVLAHRKIQKITDPESGERQRRALTGVVLPVDPDDQDSVQFVTYSKAIADQLEAARRQAESWVEQYYEKIAPGLLGVHLLFGAEPRLRQIVAKALAAYHNFFADPAHLPARYVGGVGAPIVYATSRPSERFLIRGDRTFDSVVNDLKDDIWCDLDINGNGHCIQAMHYAHENMRYANETIDLNVSLLAPIALGDMAIFARFCNTCWKTFTARQSIERDACEIVTPFVDGFGQVG